MPLIDRLDAPQTTVERRGIIQKKLFLSNFYRECYLFFKNSSARVPKGPRLEIGSGAGFLHNYIPGVLRSDVLMLPDLDIASSALDLPFRKNTLSAIYMLNVLHHIQDIAQFFTEAQQCLKPGGTLVMIEPALTCWGEFIYKHFHHEECNKKQNGWKLPAGGPLSTANEALAWIVFERDRDLFTMRFPELAIEKIDYVSPLTYLLSGGFSFRQLLPGSCYSLIKLLENLLRPFNKTIGLFMRIKIVCAK